MNNKKNNKYINVILACFVVFMFVFLFFVMQINKIHNMEIEETEKIEELKSEFNKDNNMIPDFGDNGDNRNNRNNRIYGNNIYFNNDQTYNNEDDGHNDTDHNNIDNKASAQKIYEDCIIEIPDIDLTKIVYSGIDREKKLDDYDLITAASDMKFSNGGNYIVCGHASRLYGHSLNRIREVHKDTLIRIWANNKVEDFKVNKVYYENMNDTNKYCRQTNNNEITIISCAKYISKESYIIIKAIPK